MLLEFQLLLLADDILDLVFPQVSESNFEIMKKHNTLFFNDLFRLVGLFGVVGLSSDCRFDIFLKSQ